MANSVDPEDAAHYISSKLPVVRRIDSLTSEVSIA